MKKNGKVLFCFELKVAAVKKSDNEKVSLIMKIAIMNLQKIDLLVKHHQIVLSKLKYIFIRVF